MSTASIASEAEAPVALEDVERELRSIGASLVSFLNAPKDTPERSATISTTGA